MLNYKFLSKDRCQFVDTTPTQTRWLATGVYHKGRGWRFRCDINKLWKYEHLKKLLQEMRDL